MFTVADPVALPLHRMFTVAPAASTSAGGWVIITVWVVVHALASVMATV